MKRMEKARLNFSGRRALFARLGCVSFEDKCKAMAYVALGSLSERADDH